MWLPPNLKLHTWLEFVASFIFLLGSTLQRNDASCSMAKAFVRNVVQEGWEVREVKSHLSYIIPRRKKGWRIRRMDIVLTTSCTLDRALVFAISFDPHSEISFITLTLQMRKWRLRQVRSFALRQ